MLRQKSVMIDILFEIIKFYLKILTTRNIDFSRSFNLPLEWSFRRSTWWQNKFVKKFFLDRMTGCEGPGVGVEDI